jgi:hypothetical protein
MKKRLLFLRGLLLFPRCTFDVAGFPDKIHERLVGLDLLLGNLVFLPFLVPGHGRRPYLSILHIIKESWFLLDQFFAYFFWHIKRYILALYRLFLEISTKNLYYFEKPTMGLPAKQETPVSAGVKELPLI